MTQPDFARENRLTVVIRISILPLIFVAAPKNFHTDRQNNWCFFNVLWYKNVRKISNKTANINVKTAVYTNVNGDIVTHRKQQK